MERPTAIALALTVVLVAAPLGGCLGFGGGGTGDGAGTDTPTTDRTTDWTTEPPTTEPPRTEPPTTEPPTTDPPTTEPPTGYVSIRVEAERVVPGDLVEDLSLAPGEFDPERRPLVRRLLNRSNHTVRTTHLTHPGHVEAGEFVATNGTYYRVAKTVTDRWDATAYQFELSNVRDPNASVRSGAVAFANLSAVDRDLAREGLPPADRRGTDASFTAGFLYAFGNGTVPGSSALADGNRHYVRYDDHYYRIRRTDTESVTRYRIRYEAEPAFDSRAAFASALVERHVANVSALPNGSGERALLVRALEGGDAHWEADTGEPPADFRALRELFAEYASETGAMYVRHDGDLYRVDLLVAVA